MAPINSIKDTGKKAFVYDIHVESEFHNFYANGVVVHNSVLDAARKTWKQLQLAEDAMLVYRLTRSPDRRVFYVEVGNLDVADIGPFIQAMQQSVKKAPIIDSRNGHKDFKYNPQNVTEDFFLPVRGEHHSRIDTLPGASNLNDIADLQYLEGKLFCALVVPKAYLNFTEGLQGGTTLSQSDIRFANTIIGFQEAVLMELRKIATVHLFTLGFKEDFENFELKLNNPSTQRELMKLEIMKARLEVGKEWHSMDANSPASWTWVMETIHGFSKNDIKKMLIQKKVEKKLFAEIDAGAETFRKTGIFKAIDQKYEIAGADPNGGTGGESDGGGEGGDFGGSSALGDGGGTGLSGDEGGMPDMGGPGDAGAGPTPPAPGGGDSGNAAADMALSEARKKKPRQSLESMIEELFIDDNSKKAQAVADTASKEVIIEKSAQSIKQTGSLIASLQRKFGDLPPSRREVIKETVYVEDIHNPLLQDYNEHTERINSILERIDDGTDTSLPDDTDIEEELPDQDAPLDQHQ